MQPLCRVIYAMRHLCAVSFMLIVSVLSVIYVVSRFIVMLSTIILRVVILSVVAPWAQCY
jgi:hypothetical protein